MSAAEAAAEDRCASCGIAGGDDIKLKNCTACKLVKYCGVECQRKHRSQHKLACKKRAAELKDELLFKQPESTHLGDCPICCLPIPNATKEDTVRYHIQTCCSKLICSGCSRAKKLIEREEKLPATCPFCRHPVPSSDEEISQNRKKRVEANDPAALYYAGMDFIDAGDYKTAIEYWEKASGLGHVESHHNLSILYDDERGYVKDTKKMTHNREQAAIGGHPFARLNLSAQEQRNGNTDRAIKHLIIAANLGLDEAMQKLHKAHAWDLISTKDFIAVVGTYQAAVKATKSPQRDEAEAAQKMMTRTNLTDLI